MQHTVRMRLILALSKSVAQRYQSDVEVWTLRVFLFNVLPRSLSSRLRLCLFTVWGRMNHWTCWDQWQTGQVLRLCEKIVSSFTALMWCPVCQSPEGALRRARSLRRISLQSVLRSDIVWNVKKYVALQRPDHRLAFASLPTLRTPYTSQLHRRAEKGTTFLLWINLLIRNVIWQNLVLLLAMNIIVDVTYLTSGIYTIFRPFLCKKCDRILCH